MSRADYQALVSQIAKPPAVATVDINALAAAIVDKAPPETITATAVADELATRLAS